MGIGRSTAALLSREAQRRPFSGRVLQLGRQDVSWRPEGYQGPLSDEPLLFWYGFGAVHSTDVSNYERPTFVCDLNAALPGLGELPGKSRYDLVLDGGTLEHVFHLPNALANVHEWLKVGGRVIHVNGVSNWVEHGFYSFSPCFWWDYYSANKYEINDCFLIMSGRDEAAPRSVYRYTPGCIDDVQRGTIGGVWYSNELSVVECFFVATKTDKSTSGVVPQQRRLSSLWKGEPPKGGGLEYLGVV